jgi:hypothetical protein
LSSFIAKIIFLVFQRFLISIQFTRITVVTSAETSSISALKLKKSHLYNLTLLLKGFVIEMVGGVVSVAHTNIVFVSEAE